MTQCDYVLPPTMSYHLEHFPSAYIYIWIIAAICFITTMIIIVPHWRAIRAEGIRLRDEEGEILVPLPFMVVLLITGFPAIVSTFSLFTLLAPISEFVNDFIIHGYEGLCLYFFARMLIMYLGSFKAIMNAFRSTQPNNYWASPPLGCCFKKCIKPKMMNERDFRLIYGLIIQYAILPPVLSFTELLRVFSGQDELYSWTGYLNRICALVCIYGLFCLMNASKDILHEHNIHGKFYTIKGAVGALLLPPLLLGDIIKIKGPNDVYDDDVMTTAWCKVATMMVITCISFAFRKNFTINDCNAAWKNESTQSWIRRSVTSLVNSHNNSNNSNNNNNNKDRNDSDEIRHETMIDIDMDYETYKNTRENAHAGESGTVSIVPLNDVEMGGNTNGGTKEMKIENTEKEEIAVTKNVEETATKPLIAGNNVE